MEMMAPFTEAGKIAGNSTLRCKTDGNPPTSKTEMLTSFVAEALAAFENPKMRHTMAELGTALETVGEKMRTSGTAGAAKEIDTTTLGTLRLEQVAPAVDVPLKDEKRKPITDTVLKEVPSGTLNDNVKVTLELRGACVACWLRISASLSARS